MQLVKLLTASMAFATAGTASAGTRLGLSLGSRLGQPLGDLLPVAGSSVLLVGAVALGLGIYLSRRKRR